MNRSATLSPMQLFGLVFFAVMLVLIGVGFAIGLVVCGLVAVLMALGVISSSLAIGSRTGKPRLGVRAFLIQCGLIVGIPAGAFCAWLADSFFAAYGSGWRILVYGGLGGAISGVLVAWLLDRMLKRVRGRVSIRISTNSSTRNQIDRKG